MLLITDILLILVLIVTARQDFRARAISWFLIPSLLILTIIQKIYAGNMELLWRFFLLNNLFLIIQLGLVWIYFSLKNKKLVNIIDTQIGLGDILFFMAIAGLFSPLNFIVFYLVSLLLSLFSTIVIKLWKKPEEFSIPLAGYFSLFLIALIFLQRFNELNLYNDTFPLNWITN